MSKPLGMKNHLVFIYYHYKTNPLEYTMNRRSNKRYNQKQTPQKKVIRCDNLSRPVFDTDSCGEFKTSVGKESEKICKNCTHSF
jgi:hypothetical protein